MKTRTLGTGTLGILAAATLALAASTTAKADTGSVPFNASFTGVPTWSGSTVTFQGKGLATLMGAITNQGVTVLDYTVPVSCAGGVANTHTETLTAANGDTLVFRMADVSCPIGNMVFHGSGNWTVIGGTGHFQGASGQGTSDGIVDFGAGTYGISLVGSIVPPTN